MLEVSVQRQPGDGLIVWYDLMSTDPASTDTFYGGVFGWQVDAESTTPTGYRAWSQQGQPFGGVLPWDVALGSGTWMPYVQISDLDQLVDLTEDLGGAVHVEPTEIPGIGRYAVVSDPTGAPVSLFEPPSDRRAPATMYNRGEGFPIWNELITTGLDAATGFYRALIGWELVPISPGAHPYTVAKMGGVAAAGLYQPASSPAHSMWIVSFQTSDIDASIARVQQLGGKVIHPINDASGIGRTAWVADPTGAVFGLMQPESGWLDRL